MQRLSNIAFLLVSLVGFELIGLAQSSTITTYAGIGRWPVSGTQAITQPIEGPPSIIPDGFGGFYFPGSQEHRIYRVDANGTVTVVAGNGTAGFSGDGGPALAAQLRNPSDMALDGAGNLFISDSGNRRIRKVTPSGVITTVAGVGTQGFSGDGGLAADAQLGLPTGLTVDGAGSLFFVDFHNYRIRQITPSGVITTVAGNGTYGFSGDGGSATAAQLGNPSSVAVDRAGNLFIADTDNQRIRKVSPDGVINNVAGSGPVGPCIEAGFSGDGGRATAAELSYPARVVVDGAGNLLIADTGNGRIRNVRPDGVISTVAGTGSGVGANFSGDGGSATAAQLGAPSGVAVDTAGNLFIAGNNRVRKVNLAGIISTVAGIGTFSGDGGAASSALLNYPTAVAVDRLGNLFLADSGNYRIRKVTPAGIISTVAGNGGYGFSGDGGLASDAQLGWPASVAVDGAGNLFIADSNNYRIRKVTPAGIISTVAGNGIQGSGGDGGPATSAQLGWPTSVAVDGSGNLFIADNRSRSIRQVTPAGFIMTAVGMGGYASSTQLGLPTSIAVDGTGNLFIADYEVTGSVPPWVSLTRILKVTPGGVITTVVGTDARLGDLSGIAIDAEGNLFIANSRNNRIHKVTPDGVISTVAGIETAGDEGGFSGDFGPAASAQLNHPRGVAVDAEGNLFIADSFNNRIRKVTTLMGPVLSMDSTQARVGDSWSVTVSYGTPNSPVRLWGTSNGQSWEVQRWGTTDNSGSFKEDGRFAEGTQGSHTLQVEIDGVFSNMIAFRVSN